MPRSGRAGEPGPEDGHRGPDAAKEGAGIDFTTHLKSFNHKVLFLRGDRNEAAPLAQQQELAASYADAEVVTIAGGHELVWESTDAYLDHARAYFQAIGFQAVSP